MKTFFRYRYIEIYSVLVYIDIELIFTPFGCNWTLKLSTDYKESDFNN